MGWSVAPPRPQFKQWTAEHGVFRQIGFATENRMQGLSIPARGDGGHEMRPGSRKRVVTWSSLSPLLSDRISLIVLTH